MGSFCSTAGDQTSQTSAPNPMAMGAYQNILSRAQQVASTPYQAYQGQLTAGLDPTQQAGISNINSAYGMAQPYFQQAQQYAQQGAAPVANLSGADIQRYQNPYQQAVIDATMGNINEADQRQQQMVKGNAAMAGALGGDRQAVAQAELARQQGLARNQTLAGLQSQGYTQALGAAQGQQQNQQANAQRAANAAYAYGQLGTGAQGAQLQGAGAQLGAGAVAQQTEQARLAAQYGQFQQQQAFPYQQLSWLSGVSAPIGSQMGQTQTTTGPAKDNTSQYIGMGLNAAAMFMSDRKSKENIHKIGQLNDGQPIYRFNYKDQPGATQIGLISQEVEKSHPEAVHHVNGMGAVDYDAATADAVKRASGGRIGYASGGSTPFDFISDVGGYIPRAPQLAVHPMQMSAPSKQAANSGMNTLGTGVNAMAGALGKSGFSGLNNLTGGATTNFGYNSSMMPETFAQDYGSADQLFPGYGSGMVDSSIGGFGFADGGLVDTVRAIRKGLRSYADGGDVDERTRERGLEALKYHMGGEQPWYKEPTRGKFWVDHDKTLGMVKAHNVDFAVPRRQYADGGDVETIDYDGGDWAPQEVAPQAMADWRGGADLVRNDVGEPNAPVSPAVGLPPEITAGQSGGPSPYPMPQQAMGYSGSPMPPAMGPQGVPSAQQAEAKRVGLLGLLTEEQQRGMMAAGAGMMAGSNKRGEGLRNIGLGLQSGMKSVDEYRKQELAKATSQRSADAEARKLMHDLRRDSVAEQQFKQRQSLDERKFKELQKQHGMPKVMTDENGLPILVDPLSGKIVGRPNSPSETTQPPSKLPGQPGAAKSEEEQGIIPTNARLVQGGAYNYKDDAPYMEKGMDVPDPQGVAGRSPRSLQTDAEYYLQTGKLPTVRGGKSPVAIQDTQYKRAVQNYAGALAQSRGLSPDQTAEMWRTAPGMLRFILGADGRATVSLGTAVRHLDTLKQLADAWKEGSTIGNWQTWNRLSSSVRREFGDTAVTNLESASRIVGPEIIKALGVAGAGTEHDRSTAAGQFMTGKGFDQILGAVDTTQKLLGGQLEGKKRQAAQAGVSEERFKGLMGDRAYEVLSGAEKGKGSKPELSGVDKQALDWANANPKDPRAEAIKKRLGVP